MRDFLHALINYEDKDILTRATGLGGFIGAFVKPALEIAHNIYFRNQNSNLFSKSYSSYNYHTSKIYEEIVTQENKVYLLL